MSARDFRFLAIQWALFAFGVLMAWMTGWHPIGCMMAGTNLGMAISETAHCWPTEPQSKRHSAKSVPPRG